MERWMCPSGLRLMARHIFFPAWYFLIFFPKAVFQHEDFIFLSHEGKISPKSCFLVYKFSNELRSLNNCLNEIWLVAEWLHKSNIIFFIAVFHFCESAGRFSAGRNEFSKFWWKFDKIIQSRCHLPWSELILTILVPNQNPCWISKIKKYSYYLRSWHWYFG